MFNLNYFFEFFAHFSLYPNKTSIQQPKYQVVWHCLSQYQETFINQASSVPPGCNCIKPFFLHFPANSLCATKGKGAWQLTTCIYWPVQDCAGSGSGGAGGGGELTSKHYEVLTFTGSGDIGKIIYYFCLCLAWIKPPSPLAYHPWG